MKNLFYLFCLAVVSSVILSSCEKEEVIMVDTIEVSPTLVGQSNFVAGGGEEKCTCRYQITSLAEPVDIVMEAPQSSVAVHELGLIPFVDDNYSKIDASYNPFPVNQFSWQTFSQGMSTSGSINGLPSGYVDFLPGEYQNDEIQYHRLDMFSYVDIPNAPIGVRVSCYKKKAEEVRTERFDFDYVFTRPSNLQNTDWWSEDICFHCENVSLIGCLP